MSGTERGEEMQPIESVLRTLQRCIDKGGMTYHGDDLGVLAAAIIHDATYAAFLARTDTGGQE